MKEKINKKKLQEMIELLNDDYLRLQENIDWNLKYQEKLQRLYKKLYKKDYPE